MNNFKLIVSFAFLVFFVACSHYEPVQVNIIPEPFSIAEKDEKPFIVNEQTKISISDSLMLPAVSLLEEVLKTNLEVVWESTSSSAKNQIVFKLDQTLDSLTNEGYFLDISSKGIVIRSSGFEGCFYAVETIRQLLPPDRTMQDFKAKVLPAVKIVDKPKFAWRGMHLDVSRHFMPLDFVKKYIDYLAMHKLNVFHWHLVDGIGWRIEIKSHPELTDVGAWRVLKTDKKPWEDFEVWRKGDPRPKYGGYYTQEEIKEVVAYARSRFITVVPEIEMPGHSNVVFQCYPQFLCKDDNGNPLKNIGVYCASNQGSYNLLEDILEEVLELFPSEYIHIGGDEVSKQNWENCAACKKLMKENNYDSHELQSHFINHFDEYLKNNGRILIGWHEILEGKLSESAAIMYWGGENSVSDFLEKGHPMVLTTGSHLYFDHYQSLSVHEPQAFGGFAPLKKVFNYNPVPVDLEKEYVSNILGVQANVWTEYMNDPERVEYMTIPRMAALAEIAWQDEGLKDWEKFRVKMDDMIKRYREMGINYSNSAFRPDIQFTLNRETKNLEVSLDPELIADVYYTTDGSTPNPETSMKYDSIFELDRSCVVSAVAVKEGKMIGQPEIKEALLHKARGAKVTVDPVPTGKYSALGGYTLVDTEFGGDKWGNGKWLGILSHDFVTTIELDEPEEISTVIMSCIEQTGAGIYFPSNITVALSNDGASYHSFAVWNDTREQPLAVNSEILTQKIKMQFKKTSCKFIKVSTKYHRKKNSGVFVFVDELIVE